MKTPRYIYLSICLRRKEKVGLGLCIHNAPMCTCLDGCMHRSQHFLQPPSTWALWNEQSRAAFLAWSLAKPVNSTEGCAELDSQDIEIDWQVPKALHTLCYPACHSAIYVVSDRFHGAQSLQKDLWVHTAHQDNAGSLSQVEKDKLHVTCITLSSCPDRWREHAVSMPSREGTLEGVSRHSSRREAQIQLALGDHGLDSKKASKRKRKPESKPDREKARKRESKKARNKKARKNLNWEQKDMIIYCCPHIYFSQVIHI